MTDRTIILNDTLYRVPRFIQRSFANKGGWTIAVPGINRVFTDWQYASTDAALEAAKEELAMLLAFEPDYMVKMCSLSLIPGDANETWVAITSGSSVCILATITLKENFASSIYKKGFNSPEFKAFISADIWSVIVAQWVKFVKCYVRANNDAVFMATAKTFGRFKRIAFVQERA